VREAPKSASGVQHGQAPMVVETGARGPLNQIVTLECFAGSPAPQRDGLGPRLLQDCDRHQHAVSQHKQNRSNGRTAAREIGVAQRQRGCCQSPPEQWSPRSIRIRSCHMRQPTRPGLAGQDPSGSPVSRRDGGWCSACGGEDTRHRLCLRSRFRSRILAPQALHQPPSRRLTGDPDGS
jgi:hypothetical protein